LRNNDLQRARAGEAVIANPEASNSAAPKVFSIVISPDVQRYKQ